LDPVTAIMPLVFVVLVTMVKEAVEDLRRHNADKKANAKPCEKFQDKELVTVKWEDLLVGDIIKV
jgi:magnesium-transporting ATPase (P-type)